MSLNKYNSSTGVLENIASGQRVVIYTKAAYEAAKQVGTLPADTLVMITDDVTERPHMIAASSSSGTFTQKIQSLQSAYTSMSEDERNNSFLLLYSDNEPSSLKLYYAYGSRYSAPAQCQASTANPLVTFCSLSLDPVAYGNMNVNSSGISYADYTSVSNTQKIELWSYV